MKTPLKNITPLIAIIATITVFTIKTNAQDATSAIITAAGGAGGFAIGNALKLGAGGTAALAGAIPMIADFGYNIFKNKEDENKIEYYISGRNYERWIQSQTIWYQSTLDPYTGRPQAFSGLNAMNDGMPKQEENTGNKQITEVYTVPVKVPAGTYEGTPYTERVTDFPKLP